MAVRTKKLVHVGLASGSDTLLYTAPAGETVIVKSVAMWSSSGNTVLLYLFNGVVGAQFARAVLSAGIPDYRDVWVVLQPGDQLWTSPLNANNTRYLVSGTELEGVAD